MKKILPILLLLIYMTLSGYAQRHKVFFDGSGAVTDSSKAESYIIRNKVSDTAWIIKQYAMNDTILMMGTYKDEALSIPNGKFLYYKKPLLGVLGAMRDTLNYIQTAGEVVNGIKNGQWIEYYPNGSRRTLNTFRNGKLNGLSQVYNDDNTVVVEGKYVNDEKEGSWLTLSRSGKVVKTEYFEYGKVVERTVAQPHYRSPVPPKEFNDFIVRNLSDMTNKNMSGDNFVNCTITKEGKLTNPTISGNGLSPEIQAKLIAVLPNSPLWAPPYDESLKRVIDDTIIFSVKIKKGNIEVVYSQQANALIYQMYH